MDNLIMFSGLIRGWGHQSARQYPALASMLRVWLSAHHDDFGNSIEDMLHSYLSYQMPANELLNEISVLIQVKNDNDLDVIMTEIGGDEFRPEPWSETWRSFLTGALATLSRENQS